MNNLFEEIGIIPKGNNNQQKVVCPNCAKIGKTNLKDTCLSIDLQRGLYNCHKCGWSGCVKLGEKISYQRPIKTNFTKLTDTALGLFTGRGITQDVVNSNKIVQEGDWVVFPYLKNGELINVKKRSITTKDFRQGFECQPILYNYDRIKDAKEIIITEGEFDCMAFEVAGFTNVTTVNQGAPNINDKNLDKKLECISNCFEVFDRNVVVYIAVDKDANGAVLESELIRRIGAEKCKIINFPNDLKDANDVLLYSGKQTLKDCYNNAKQVKVSGIYTVDDVEESMLSTFRNGKKRGTTTYFGEFDDIWTHRTGEVTLWTGYMNEGKSTFVKQLLLLLATFDGEKTGVFSPEEFPSDEFYDDLIHSYIGKSTDKYYGNVMNEMEYNKGIDFIKKHFFYTYPDDDFSWESIEKKMDYLILKYGINRILLDPFNQFDHILNGMAIDMYVSKFMSKLKRYALSKDVAIHLVAHQVTPVFVNGQDYPKPNAYKIKGGGTFADKADNAGWIWQPFRNTNKEDKSVIVGFDKVKKKRLVGKGGEATFLFDIATNRYTLNGFSPFVNNVSKQTELLPTEKSAVSSPNTDFSREVKRISESKYTELGEEDINVY